MVLSGGADAPISLGIVKGFILMKILTDSWNNEPERGSRPFSVDRDGFVVAEGAWMFVLEEYEHARARGAKIKCQHRNVSMTMYNSAAFLLRAALVSILPSATTSLSQDYPNPKIAVCRDFSSGDRAPWRMITLAQ